MPIPYSTFAPDKVHCPSCHSIQNKLGHQCEFCGYTAYQAIEKFPYAAPQLETLVDPDGRLAKQHRESIRAKIAHIEYRFPQVSVYIVLAKLPEGTDVREFGYWLFNASPPRDEMDAKRRKYSILFVLDRTARHAGLTVGYGLDVFLGDTVLTDLLQCCESPFKGGNYGKGILALLDALLKQLTSTHETAMRQATKSRSNTPVEDEAEIAAFRKSARHSGSED